MVLTPSKLRTNLYNYLDEVLNGKTLEIARKGKIIKIVSDKKTSRLENIIPKKVIKDEKTNVNWQESWKPFI